MEKSDCGSSYVYHGLDPRLTSFFILKHRFYRVLARQLKLKIGYSRICTCTRIPVFCLLPGPADKNKLSRPSLIASQTELLLLNLNGVQRSEHVTPNSNSSSLGAD